MLLAAVSSSPPHPMAPTSSPFPSASTPATSSPDAAAPVVEGAICRRAPQRGPGEGRGLCWPSDSVTLLLIEATTADMQFFVRAGDRSPWSTTTTTKKTAVYVFACPVPDLFRYSSKSSFKKQMDELAD
uniref:Uncharacterized protein n=1 Tax=Oryza meridionalis TaxID=40149 RepID=A0A0E0DDG6_9ORYZ